MQVDVLSSRQGFIDMVQDRQHLRVGRQAKVWDREAPVAQLQAALPRTLLKQRKVRAKLVLFGQVDEGIDTGVQKDIQSPDAARYRIVRGVFACKEPSWQDPIAFKHCLGLHNHHGFAAQRLLKIVDRSVTRPAYP